MNLRGAVAVALIVAALGAGDALGAKPDYCCIVELTASYNAKSAQLSARWAAPPEGVRAVEIRAASRLGADGVADLSGSGVRGRAAGGSATLGAGPLATILDNHGGVFVQVRFVCATPKPAPYCSSGAFWSHPAHVKEESGSSGGSNNSGSSTNSASASSISTILKKVHMTSNGTNECLLAISKVNSVIADIKANTAAALEAQKHHQSTQKYAVSQNELLKELTSTLADQKAACKK